MRVCLDSCAGESLIESNNVALSKAAKGVAVARAREKRRVFSLLPFTAGMLALLLSACNKPDASFSSVTIEHQISPQPPHVGTGTVTLKLADAAGKPLTGAGIIIEGNMSHPGMKPEFGKAREIAPGRYQAPLEFTMAGDWVILIHVTFPDGTRLEREVDVKGVRTN